MKNVFIVIVFVFSYTILFAQSSANTIFRQGDKIKVEFNSETNFHYSHKLQKGQSLYALSKVFKVSLSTLLQYNNLNDVTNLKIGQIIRVPINDDFLFKGTNLDGIVKGHYIPVFYTTKPKDNLYRISRVYFNQPTGNLIDRNNLHSQNLALGQDILIGWWPIDSTSPNNQIHNERDEFEEVFEDEAQEPNTQPIYSTNILSTEKIEGVDSIQLTHPLDFNTALLGNLTYADNMKEIKKSEVANWDNTIHDNGTVYVLHKSAIIDSYVEMYNPTIKRSVRAKVIGRIPYGAYASNVNLVLSPRAAKLLGALNKRFKVEIKALVYKES